MRLSEIENSHRENSSHRCENSPAFVRKLRPNSDNLLKDTNPPLMLGDIDGRKRLFPTTNRENRPWRRLLATHSIFTHRKAQEDGFLQDDQVTSEQVSATELMKFSLDDEAQARIKLLLNDGT